MSELYVDKKDFRPLILPEKGEQLERGRQYVLTPLARLILQEKYGLFGVPTVVECIQHKVARTLVQVMRTNLDTGKSTYSIQELPGQEATFRVFLGVGRVLKFEVDLVKLEEFAPFYADSHKLPALEDDWFATRCLPPTNRKFRGCTLRWWSKSEEVKLGESFKPYMRKRVKEESKVDLSLFAI